MKLTFELKYQWLFQVKMVHDQAPQGPKLYRSLPHAMSHIYKEFGLVKGFLGGLMPTVSKVAICNAIRFAGAL